MNYVSTRGEAETLDFEGVLLAGLARDGGLYVPSRWPQLSREEIASFAGAPYGETALRVLKPFVGETIGVADLRSMIDRAYARFRHPAVVPLMQSGPNDFVLELFHGPTLAFKDVAMQLLGLMIDHVLARRGKRVTIIGATSGDTGAAAVEAFRGSEAVDLFMLHPKGRISGVQRRQMTTAVESNIHNIAVEGTFDDCQRIVKELFSNLALRDRLSFAGVNSINWARVMAQCVYYFTAATTLGAPDRKVAFCVPTGNFGDIYAGYIAKMMGLPIAQLIIATNRNDILVRTLASGRYEVQGVAPTQSPSMDIQVSSNFERLLFALSGHNAEPVRRMMAGLRQAGAFSLAEGMLEKAQNDFAGFAVDEKTTTAAIGEAYRQSGTVIDPHTAVGMAAAKAARAAGVVGPEIALITLATAHAAKFPAAVEQAIGIEPALPERMRAMTTAQERVSTFAADTAEIARFIEDRARTARQEV